MPKSAERPRRSRGAGNPVDHPAGDTTHRVSAGHHRSRGEAVGAAVSAVALVVAILAPLYVLFLAVPVSPDASWDVRQSADNAQLLSAVAGALAMAVAALTAFTMAAHWLRSRWRLLAPAVMLLCSTTRWLCPS